MEYIIIKTNTERRTHTMKELKNRDIPYKIYLSEDEMPRYWYNVRADMKTKPAPLLHPATLQPMTAEEMGHVFCTELVKQEMDDTTAYFEIPEDIRNFYKEIRRMPSQVMAVVPVIMNSLHKDVMRGRKERLGELWVPICSSAMFDPQVMLDMATNGMFVVQTYGATETCGDGIINYAQDAKHIGAVGQGNDYLDYKIEPDGELCIRGDSIMLGYYKDPEATAAVIDKDGWFHTGDLARVDEDGYYYITGRKKNLIILDSGENVSPEELEGMLEKCPAVQECIVKELGKKIGVVVYCEKEHQQTVRDFIAQMNRTVPLYKRIGVVEFSETPLPRNGAGKLVRK